MISQLPLSVQLRDHASFANFYPGDNREPFERLQQFVRQPGPGCYFLWGEAGVGKSHLLQALCQHPAVAQQPVAYLPLAELVTHGPAMLRGFGQMQLLCIDDLQQVCGRRNWEEALFHLYNQLQDQGSRLVVAANGAPAALEITLPDLKSRLTHGVVYHLQPLSDPQKIHALQQRARFRGVALPDDVAAYLLKRCPRDMHTLFDLFERLDRASLAAQRRLTIPFVREVLAS